MIKIRSLKFWTVVVLAFITLSLTLSTTCVATSSTDMK